MTTKVARIFDNNNSMDLGDTLDSVYRRNPVAGDQEKSCDLGHSGLSGGERWRSFVSSLAADRVKRATSR